MFVAGIIAPETPGPRAGAAPSPSTAHRFCRLSRAQTAVRGPRSAPGHHGLTPAGRLMSRDSDAKTPPVVTQRDAFVVTDAASWPTPDGGMERSPSSAPARAANRPPRWAPIVACLGLVLAAAGFVIGLQPLDTPVQDCGTAFGFLLDGRIDVIADPAAPPNGLRADQVEAANANRCQERAGNRARPALTMIVVGVAIGLTAASGEAIWRRVIHSRARRASRTLGTTAVTPSGGPTGPSPPPEDRQPPPP